MKQPIFIDGRHDYTFEKLDRFYNLYYSADTAWTKPNELTMSLHDTGSGIKIKQKKKTFLGNDEALKLHILLTMLHKEEGYKIEVGKLKEL